jgi:response regulator RpfG family c-di-GMP phosphodiesterase
MPIMDGFECTKIIRNDLKISTPIVALTANAFKSELEQCIKVGMNDSITKPFEEVKLINTIYKSLQINQNISDRVSTTDLNNDQKLYNLDQLKAFSRNDNVYYNKMISIFIDQSVGALSEIREVYGAKDLIKVFQITHRIKSSILLMGIDLLREPLNFIEKNSKEQIDSEELKKQIDFLNVVLNKTINQLKNEFI